MNSGIHVNLLPYSFGLYLIFLEQEAFKEHIVIILTKKWQNYYT